MTRNISRLQEKSSIWNAVSDYHDRNQVCFVCERPILSRTAYGILDLPMHQSCRVTTELTNEYCRRPAWLATGRYEVINEVSEVIMMARLAKREELQSTREWTAMQYDDLVAEEYREDLVAMLVCIDFEWADEELVQMYMNMLAGIEEKSDRCLVCQTAIEGAPEDITVFNRHPSYRITSQMAYRELYGNETLPTGRQWAERQATAITLARLLQKGLALRMHEWNAAPQQEPAAEAVR